MIGNGGLLRVFSLARLIRGYGHLPPDMPRPRETGVSLCNLMLKSAEY